MRVRINFDEETTHRPTKAQEFFQICIIGLWRSLGMMMRVPNEV